MLARVTTRAALPFPDSLEVKMSTRIRKTGSWLVILLALTILAFGAREAFASSARFTCQYDGWTFLGWKPSEGVCEAACIVLHGEESTYRYGPEGCCSCLF
jgi:hypothetical protein